MRAVGCMKLTFEEYFTVTSEVEGILNSRPIVPMPSDPSDFSTLALGYYLIGRPLNSIPDPNLFHKPDNNLCRWQSLTN